VVASETGDLLLLADRVRSFGTRVVADADAVLIEDGRIVATGPRDSLRARAPHARVLDLSGTTLTPGLTDAHIHLVEWAFSRREVDLSAARSPAHAAAAVAAASDGSAGWMRGRGWNPHLWEGEEPAASFLDEAFPDRPVALQSHDMHALWVNGEGLRRAGITAATPDPDGGRIVRDGAGTPTGLLLENAGPLVARHIPAPTAADAIDAIVDAQAALHALGITGVHSFPGIHIVEPSPLGLLETLRSRGALRLRVLQHIALDRLEHAIALGLRGGFGGEWIRIGGVKMFLDGALGSRTAWMRRRYETTDDDCGIQVLDEADFRAIVRRAAAAGIPSTVHAIGDAAVALALDVLSAPDTRVPAMPHRIEHVQCCPPERFADAARAGIVCSMQPAHLITDWTIADRHWGPQRSRGAYAFGSLLRAGAILAFGSDVPVEPVDPRLGLHAAALRRDLDGAPAGGWYPDERIALADALLAYTVGPARAAGLGTPAGTLAPGAPADLAAWDSDPCGDADMILQMRCTTTMVGGEIVYSDL
jgi:predicted amidohydrolase YtcJ